MDHKVMSSNQKIAIRQHPNKAKKKSPLRVVYITNPIKIKATASEFRALVQELTGQDSDVTGPGSFEEEIKATEEHNYNYVHAAEEGTKQGPLEYGFCGLDSFEGMMASSGFWNEGAHDLCDEFQVPVYGCNVN